MTRKAFCPTCRIADYVDARWTCLWCGTVTLTVLRSGRRSCIVSASRLRELHERYALGESIGDIAASVPCATQTLRTAWWAAGLPTRSVDAMHKLPSSGERNSQWRGDIDNDKLARDYVELGNLRLVGERNGMSASAARGRLAAAGVAIGRRGVNRIARPANWERVGVAGRAVALSRARARSQRFLDLLSEGLTLEQAALEVGWTKRHGQRVNRRRH